MTMRKILATTLLASSLLLAATPALAVTANGGMRVAVFDREAALLASDVAKAAQDKLNADMKPLRDKHEQLRRDIKAMEERFQKEVATMTEKDKRALRAQADAKAQEFNSLIQQVQKRTQDAQQELLRRLLPSMETIVEDLRKAGNYDIILDRRAAVYVSPEFDLTRRVTDRLNVVK